MPELPEVETVVRGLRSFITKRTILQARVFDPLVVSGTGALRKASQAKARAFENSLAGEKIITIERRGKNIVFQFVSGKVLLGHLKMTGNFIYVPAKAWNADALKAYKHARVVFELDMGVLVYNDIRRFGYLLVFLDEQALRAAGHLSKGVDPLKENFTFSRFIKLLSGKRGVLKSALLRQSIVAGLGNIYIDEACFRARVGPDKLIEHISRKDIKCLHSSITYILTKAVRLGGSSTSDYVKPDGERGLFSQKHSVYGRGGKPCIKCKTILTIAKIGGRTTVYCKKCQR